MERENLEAGEDVVQSSETVGPNQIGMEMLQSGSKVNENNLRGIQTKQGIEDGGNNLQGHDSTLEVMQNVSDMCKDRMTSRPEFQVQLQEIDKEIMCFDTNEGGLKELEKGFTSKVRQPSLFRVDMGNETTFVMGQKGVQQDGKGKPKSSYTWSIIRNQTKGKDDLHVCSPKEGKTSVPLKRSFGEIDGKSEKIECSKKQRGWINDLTVEARSRPRQQQ